MFLLGSRKKNVITYSRYPRAHARGPLLPVLDRVFVVCACLMGNGIAIEAKGRGRQLGRKAGKEWYEYKEDVKGKRGKGD